MLFIKAAKILSLSLTFLPLTGCAIATGLVFASLVRGISYSPDLEDVLFNYTTLGFAFIESFAFLLFSEKAKGTKKNDLLEVEVPDEDGGSFALGHAVTALSIKDDASLLSV